MPRIVPEDAILVPNHAQRVFKGELFDVFQWPQELFDGTSATFELLRRPDTVVLIAIKDDKVVFINEEQPGRSLRLRLPGGRVEEGEEPGRAVARECAEEVGMRFADWRLISVRQPVAKIEWFVSTYIGTNLIEEFEPHPDPGEKIEIKLLDFAEAKAYITAKNSPLLDYARQLFEAAETIDDLKKLPIFQGKEV